MFKRFIHPYFFVASNNIFKQPTIISQELGKTASTLYVKKGIYLSGNFLALDKMNERDFETLFFFFNGEKYSCKMTLNM